MKLKVALSAFAGALADSTGYSGDKGG